MHITFVRQDLQDNQDFFVFPPACHREPLRRGERGRKAKILIPLRGNRHPNKVRKVAIENPRLRNENTQAMIFPPNDRRDCMFSPSSGRGERNKRIQIIL